MTHFEQALKKLIEDPKYREAVIRDSDRLTSDYRGLEPHELILLMQVWHATGDPEAMNIITLCHCCCSTTE